MKRMTLFGLVMVWGIAGLPADGEIGKTEVPYLQIHRVFCTHPDMIEQACRKYPNGFGTGLIVTTYTQISFGDPAVKDFGNYSSFFRAFRGRGLDLQVGISTSLGHTDDWTVPGS